MQKRRTCAAGRPELLAGRVHEAGDAERQEHVGGAGVLREDDGQAGGRSLHLPEGPDEGVDPRVQSARGGSQADGGESGKRVLRLRVQRVFGVQWVLGFRVFGFGRGRAIRVCLLGNRALN